MSEIPPSEFDLYGGNIVVKLVLLEAEVSEKWKMNIPC
jgi:activator of HSP90 ATPase